METNRPSLAASSPAPRLTWRACWHLARQALSSWSDDYASSMGAALAYYTMFSIAPLLLIVVSVTMDTVAQVQGHLLAQQYERLIKRTNLRGARR